MAFPTAALLDLANRILRGDVVFFVGSGFSIDSEGNSANRLMRRLLIRLVAMTRVLGSAGEKVLADLCRTFSVSAAGRGSFPFSDEEVTQLAGRYYETNEWFCRAFADLLELVAQGREQTQRDADSKLGDLLETILTTEEEIRLAAAKPDVVPFRRLGEHLWRLLRESRVHASRAAGKALFLDTMGFAEQGTMGGNPTEPDVGKLYDSYLGRLLPRHHVIARFAREGFCTTTLTTNYDLLLEGAFYVAGLASDREQEQPFPASLIDRFACIASPAQFFTEGKAHRTAVLVKMHGCVQRYREEVRRYGKQTASADPQAGQRGDGLPGYLRSMVFTYREIQNWREDSWAADFLRTLLRTRTVVFCGYSLQDPVIHDAFRTVYEEMARGRGEPASAPWAPRRQKKAPAFFFAPGGEDATEFHGTAVLRAATAAIGGVDTGFGRHPNYISFHFRNEPDFPHLDELFRWLFHAVLRLRQKECLARDLHRIAGLLLGRPRPQVEVEAVRAGFARVWRAERGSARLWSAGGNKTNRAVLDAKSLGECRHELNAMCSWTEYFHVGLLREFARAERAQQRQGSSEHLGVLRHVPWYFPAMQVGAWTAWAVVAELALRRMIGFLKSEKLCAVSSGTSMGIACDWRRLRAAASPEPTVLFSVPGAFSTPCALSIRFDAIERLRRQSRILGHPAQQSTWLLGAGDTPWPPGSPDNDNREPTAAGGSGTLQPAPDAWTIWSWAAGLESDQDRTRVCRWLGLKQPEHEQGRNA